MNMHSFDKIVIGLLAGYLFFGTAMAQDVVSLGGVEFERHTMDITSGQSELISVDINHDGHQDIIATNQNDNGIIVFLGSPQGQLTRYGAFPAGENPVGLAVADFNGDSHPDVVVANHEVSYLTLLTGDGDGGFSSTPNSRLAVEISPHPHAVRAADFDHDGHMDIVVDDRDDESLLILKGLGNGVFTTPGKTVTVGGDPYRGMAVGDVNGDGWADLVTPNPDSVGVAINTGSEGLGFADPLMLAMTSPFAVNLADFNGDGYLDIVAASDGRASLVEIFPGDVQGKFQRSDNASFRMAAGAKNIAVGDINGDGYADALICSWNSEVMVILGGSGDFQSLRLQSKGNPWGLVVSDLNKDGRDDFIIADGNRSEATVYISRITGWVRSTRSTALNSQFLRTPSRILMLGD